MPLLLSSHNAHVAGVSLGLVCTCVVPVRCIKFSRVVECGRVRVLCESAVWCVDVKYVVWVVGL